MEKASVQATAKKLTADGKTVAQTIDALNAQGFRTANGLKYNINTYYYMLGKRKAPKKTTAKASATPRSEWGDLDQKFQTAVQVAAKKMAQRYIEQAISRVR